MPSVEDVFAGDLWFFPTGLPHSLQEAPEHARLALGSADLSGLPATLRTVAQVIRLDAAQ